MSNPHNTDMHLRDSLLKIASIMRSSEFTSTVIPIPSLMDLALLSVVGFVDHCFSSWFKCYERTPLTDVIFLQQAGHVPHRPAIASKIIWQGLPSTCQIYTIRCALQRNSLFMEETCCKLYSTQRLVEKLFQQFCQLQ